MAGALLTFIGLGISGLMLIFGLSFVFRGVSKFLALQKMANTPTSKVRSVALGLVELSGAASPGKDLRSHLLGKPCVFSRLVVEKYSRFKKKWVQVGAFERTSRFRLKDASGIIPVDPDKAEYDFEFQSRTMEVFLNNDGRAAMTKAEIEQTIARKQKHFSFGPLQDYILGGKDSGYGEIVSTARIISSLAPVKSGSKSPPPGVESALMLNRFLDDEKSSAEGFRLLGFGEVRLTELIIPAGAALYVLGNAESEGGGKARAYGGLIIRKGDGGILLISDKSEKALTNSKSAGVMALAAIGTALAGLAMYLALQFI
jgi:hypothetical protein